MKIYIAGKISGDSNYKQKFEQAANEMQARGHIALNPATLPEGLSSQFYMRCCFAMIDEADAVLFLYDYVSSKGAAIEHRYCEYIGKRIIYQDGQLL